MELIAEICGWIGMVLFLVAYFLVTFKKITADSRHYQFLNLIGAIFIGYNVFYAKVWPAFVLEIVWVAIAMIALVKKT